AVMLSKLPVARAAELLGKLPGERARRVAYAVSLTAPVAPDTVRRIGLSLASQLDAAPPRAFSDDPVDRIGAILNVTAALTRDEILRGLDETDAAFAEQVRRAIFTYANIPTKIEPRDIPKIVREVDQPILVTAMAAEGAEVQAATEFILANMSQRMATALRDEIADRGKVKPKEAEEAMSSVISSIRALETAGEIVLLQPEGEED
ncbi:flagellar motor switch protein FliG, partial [Thioclava sp. BHET1]